MKPRLKRVKAGRGLMLPRVLVFAEALAKLRRRKGGIRDGVKKSE